MVPAKVQGLFFSGLSLAFKVNLSSPGFSGQWPEPQPASFRHDIPIRVSVDKPPLVPALIGFMQKTLMLSLSLLQNAKFCVDQVERKIRRVKENPCLSTIHQDCISMPHPFHGLLSHLVLSFNSPLEIPISFQNRNKAKSRVKTEFQKKKN